MSNSTNLDKYLEGKCMEMCPTNERKLREREGLLDILELVASTVKSPQPKTDQNRLVKAFGRSAAGKSQQQEEDLRPPKVLLRTVNYLLGEVVEVDYVTWNHIYDFVMDRLRAVRQDMVIQNVSRAEWISLLQPIVRFHAYAAYRLCELPITKFDPIINKTHLSECLKRLLCLYDDMDDLYTRIPDSSEHNYCEALKEDRPEFEALYIVLNLGDETALRRSLSLPIVWRTELVKICTELSLSYLEGNFVRVCSIIPNLPALLTAVASLHLPAIRRMALNIMSVAYSSKNLIFPHKNLLKLLLYENKKYLIKDCQYYGITFSEEGVHFNKSSFNNDKVAKNPKHEKFVEEKLELQSLSSLLLKY